MAEEKELTIEKALWIDYLKDDELKDLPRGKLVFALQKRWGQILRDMADPLLDTSHLSDNVKTGRERQPVFSRQVFPGHDPKGPREQWPDRKIDIMIVGEAPGWMENRDGQPLIGPSGTVLNDLVLSKPELKKRTVYITNVMKLRPTNSNNKDRLPTNEEITRHLPILKQEITILQPRLVIAVGAVSYSVLMCKFNVAAAARLREDRINMEGNTTVTSTVKTAMCNFKLMIMLHPSGPLRNYFDEYRRLYSQVPAAVEKELKNTSTSIASHFLMRGSDEGRAKKKQKV